jgi:hypothetical protein
MIFEQDENKDAHGGEEFDQADQDREDFFDHLRESSVSSTMHRRPSIYS